MMAADPQELADDDEAIAQINIIPFVDIALVLLIIFMLTANIIAKASIPVDLPQAAHGSQTVDTTLNIVVTADGALLLDGRPVEKDELRAAAERAFHTDPKVRVVIAADKNVRYDAVIQAIDLVKQVGISAFALNIERIDPR
jgi:biopolymer transport protein ExbD